ncbi:hypothetical protein [Priestia megaterium]|uniref:hypothetical protein n=1 Tax=Priestia megaterium TaxID=1404 RepID=UPI001A950641|nr:hypothetical protein [Priestia megaterium]QSX20032.1 hypothetical protein J0P05_22785 [Priestia megaterium]
MTIKKDYIPVTNEQLVHDLAIAWLTRENNDFRNAVDFTDRYLQLVQEFESAVDHATRYDVNPTAKADI